jgi:hypothetical protein
MCCIIINENIQQQAVEAGGATEKREKQGN